MKLLLLIVMWPILIAFNQQTQPVYKINTFKKIPDDFQGAGETFYLSEKDKRAATFICTTDYETALIYVNKKPIRLKAKHKPTNKGDIYVGGNYTLIIRKGQLKKAGDENYTMRALLTIKYNSMILMMKNVIGEGGD